MLTAPTPFPFAGSYALLEHEGEHQLVRIQWRRENETVVSFPLRPGASGTLRVEPARLIDATPLSPAETREFHDLDRALRGRSLRTPKQKAQALRRDALKLRLIYAPFMEHVLRELDRKAA